MKRKDEIRHKAGSIADGMIAHNVPSSECKGYYEGYIDGAKYADKTMIEKACQWLNEHMYCTPIFEHDEDENPVNYVCVSCCDSVEEFIENFRKALEE